MRVSGLLVALSLAILGGCGGGSDSVAPAQDQVFAVEVRGSGSGAGHVQSMSPGTPMDCPVGNGAPTCSLSVPEGTQIQFQAVPGSGFAFGSWESDAAGCGNTPQCSIQVTGSLSVVVRFEVDAPILPSASQSIVAALPTTISPGGESTVMVVVKKDDGTSMGGIPVTLTATGQGNTVTPASAVTDGSGAASFTFTSTSSGPKTLSAVAGGVTLLQVANIVVQGETTNLAPLASDDAFGAAQGIGQTSSVAAPGVLANDSDPEGTALTATLVGSARFGSVSLNADGSFSYTPFPMYVGHDSFSYRASDGANSSNTATVTLTVNGSEPRPTALCNDGTLSYSAHHQGTCSHHGGVRVWYD
jgi:VCBS repeat-containing protein